MNTKLIMTAAAIVTGIAGIAFTFLPGEILNYTDMKANGPLLLLLQILGALYFAFAMLNWMTKTSIIGGIYNRPIAVANFTHFFIGAMALMKGILSNPALPIGIWAIAIVYAIFAISFGLIFLRSPSVKNQ
ncbi:MAG TPA: hypothetical protein PLP23_09505 [Panacibacter sp.]|nr:hypothetical protein [Panacibacter sp.]